MPTIQAQGQNEDCQDTPLLSETCPRRRHISSLESPSPLDSPTPESPTSSESDLEVTPPEDKPWTRRQYMVLICICLGNTTCYSFYSLLAPFFSPEAMKKGATPTQVGLVFGVFQGIMFIMSPVWGRFIVDIGPKFMFVTGIFATSVCAMLFGTLAWCPDGRIFVWMCFLVRGSEAVFASATSTSSMAIAAYTFPHNISRVMGIIEVCSSIGLMLGPPLGGVLFAWGGFYLPFFVTGGLFMMCGLLSFFILPTFQAERKLSHGAGLVLLRHPIIFIVGYMVFIVQASIGFFDVGLAPHLSNLCTWCNEAYIGLFFLIPSSVVLILAPINGWVIDKNKKWGRPIIIVGSAIGALGVFGLGPSNLMPYVPKDYLPIPIIALAVAGIGMSSMVATYQEFVSCALSAGFTMNMETQGIISGAFGAFNSLGALTGPIAGGVMFDWLGFDQAATIIAFGISLAGIMLAIHELVEGKIKQKYFNRAMCVPCSNCCACDCCCCPLHEDQQAIIGNGQIMDNSSDSSSISLSEQQTIQPP